MKSSCNLAKFIKVPSFPFVGAYRYSQVTKQSLTMLKEHEAENGHELGRIRKQEVLNLEILGLFPYAWILHRNNAH